MLLHHLQGAAIFCLLKLSNIKIIRITSFYNKIRVLCKKVVVAACALWVTYIVMVMDYRYVMLYWCRSSPLLFAQKFAHTVFCLFRQQLVTPILLLGFNCEGESTENLKNSSHRYLVCKFQQWYSRFEEWASGGSTTLNRKMKSLCTFCVK